jgi:peptidoglycan/LPS O-acetylase OafA/YrhL
MTARVDTPNQNNKLLGLELIRFVTAVAVLVWHYQHFFYVADQPVEFVREQQPLYRGLSLLYQHGYSGVQIFWCISGFIFFWKYRDTIAQRVVGPLKFFVLRYSRLYPLHFGTLLLVALLQGLYFAHQGYFFVYQSNDVHHFIAQLFLASDWLPQGADHSFNGPIWSISVEVLVYLFFFVVLRYVGKSAWINLAVVLLCVAAKAAKVATPILDCLGLFYAGGLGAIALHHFASRKYNLQAGAVLAAALLVPLALGRALRLYGVDQQELASYVFLVTYVPVLLYVAAQDLPLPPLLQRTVAAAGNMTYSSYLLHFPIQLTIALICVSTGQDIPRYSVVFFAAFMLTTLVASYCTYRFFEMPAQNRIRTLFKERSRVPARSATSAV